MEINAKLYDQLLNIDYFGKCGEPINGLYDFEIYEEKDFDNAVKSLSKISWSNITLEEQNKLTTFLFKNHREDYNEKWNSQAKKNREELIPPIIQKLEEKSICKKIIEDTKWLLMSILMYDYYSEFGCKSKILEEVLTIYKSGHLPCGWSGKYPHGKIKVY